MKIKLIVVGKTSAAYLKSGELEYQQRLKHYVRFEEIIIPDIKNSKNLSKSDLKNKEGNLILSKIDNSDQVVLLDDKGKMFSSSDFASYLSEKMIRSTKSLVFVIGGAFGFSDASLSKSKY